MLDIKLIRQNPQKFDESMQKRGCDVNSQQILKLDEEKRQKIVNQQELQAQRNDLAKNIALAKKSGDKADDLMVKSKIINENLKKIEDELEQVGDLEQILLNLPNIADDSVPFGLNENNNLEVSRFGTPRAFDFTPKSHDEIGENLGLLDFKQSAVMSGARFSTLTGDLAKLERALSNFMLDVALENGYLEVSPPNLVKSEAMQFSGQLPKFAEEAFKTTNDYWLIPTAEVSLVNMVSKTTLKESDLPIRFTAYTPCFRSEAGSAGKDTKGMIRQHQFKKVELVSITKTDDSAAEHERMTNIACSILEKLNLSYRKMLLCSGDMGFCAQKTYDLEVWLPSQNKYREISSCSNCGDFQARRGSIKYKDKDGKNQFAHTLNGSSLAVGRTLIAILENYQNQDGSVNIPPILVKYMNGTEIIKKST